MTELTYPPNLPKHRVYEMVVANILQKLDGDAVVSHDVQVPVIGDDRTRQVDVYIKGRVAGFPLDIVVDCKHYGKPLDVKDVDSFLGMMEDIKPNMSVLIGLNGFTGGAKQRAKKEGGRVNLCSVFAEGQPEFSSEIGLGTMILCERSDIQMRVRFSNGTGEQVQLQVPKDQSLFQIEDLDGHREYIMELAKIVLSNDEGLSLAESGVVRLDTNTYKLVNGNALLQLGFLEVDFRLKLQFFKRKASFTRGVAVLNESGSILSADNLTTDWVPTSADEGWEPVTIDEVEELRNKMAQRPPAQ